MMKMTVAAHVGGVGGGPVIRVKDGCHTVLRLKVGQLSEGQQRDPVQDAN